MHLIIKTKHTTLDFWKAALGTLFGFIGLFAPSIFPEDMLNIYQNLHQAAEEMNSSYLIVASIKLFCLNASRVFPLYLGTFLMIQSFQVDNRVLHAAKNIVFSGTLIPILYTIISAIYKIRYDFAVPALLILSLMLVVDRLPLDNINMFKKVILLCSMTYAFECLDQMPALSGHFFGGGETTTELRVLAEQMGAADLLTYMNLVFFVMFIIFSMMLGIQISVESQLRNAKKDIEADQEQLIAARMRLLDSRINKEQQYLVHDLKAPLTSLQIWSDVLRLKAEQAGRTDCAEYFDHIDKSIHHMSLLISEILNAKSKSPFPVGEIVKTFSSQTSPARYAGMLSVDCSCSSTKIEVNRTNLVRALINLAENASHSITHDHGKISVTVEEKDGFVLFVVRDNGCGIEEDMQEHVWDMGVSGRNSSGVGLSFVRAVVTDMGGTCYLQSKVRVGTDVTIKIPVYEN